MSCISYTVNTKIADICNICTWLQDYYIDVEGSYSTARVLFGGG